MNSNLSDNNADNESILYLPDQHQHHRHRRKFISQHPKSFFVNNKLKKHLNSYILSPTSSSSISNFHAKRFLLINSFDNNVDQNFIKVSCRKNVFKWSSYFLNKSKNEIQRLSNHNFHYSNYSSMLIFYLIAILLLIFSSSTKAFASANYGNYFDYYLV